MPPTPVPRSEDSLDGFVVLHAPIIGLGGLCRPLPPPPPPPAERGGGGSGSGGVGSGGCDGRPHVVESEYVVPIDVNAFLQDVERGFAPPAGSLLRGGGDRQTVWGRVWNQFSIDLPRQHLTVNGVQHTDPQAVFNVLSTFLDPADSWLVVMLAQQCTLALPFEILTALHADHDRGVYLGEARPEELRAHACRLLHPERMAVDVAVRFPPAQSGGLPGAVACTVAIAKAFRVFRVTDEADSALVSTIEVSLEFDLRRDPEVLLAWRWRRRCPHCRPGPDPDPPAPG